VIDPFPRISPYTFRNTIPPPLPPFPPSSLFWSPPPPHPPRKIFPVE
jgi:hypothetical protein